MRLLCVLLFGNAGALDCCWYRVALIYFFDDLCALVGILAAAPLDHNRPSRRSAASR
jgi:hypothetical protein